MLSTGSEAIVITEGGFSVKRSILAGLIILMLLTGCTAAPEEGSDRLTADRLAFGAVRSLDGDVLTLSDHGKTVVLDLSKADLSAIGEAGLRPGDQILVSYAAGEEPCHAIEVHPARSLALSPLEGLVPGSSAEEELPAAKPSTGSSSAAGEGENTSAAELIGPLAGHEVRVYDETAQGVGAIGEFLEDGAAYVFYDARGERLGSISSDEVLTIIRENGIEDLEPEAQLEWFVRAFNDHRGVSNVGLVFHRPGTEEAMPPPEEVLDVPMDSSAVQPPSQTGVDTADYARKVIDLVNAEREAEGLDLLAQDGALMEDAAVRAQELVESFSHTRPNGEQGVAMVMDREGYLSAGENIAWGQGSPDAVMEDWMESDGHRANILREGFDSIGVGCYQAADGSLYWVQLFGGH